MMKRSIQTLCALFIINIALNIWCLESTQPSLLIANFKSKADDSKPWGILISRLLMHKLNFAPNELIRMPFPGWIDNDIARLWGNERIKTPISLPEAIKLGKIHGIEKTMTGEVIKQDKQIRMKFEIFDLNTSKTLTQFEISGELKDLPKLISDAALKTAETLMEKIPDINRKYISRLTPKDSELFIKALDAYSLLPEKSSEAAERWNKIIMQDKAFDFAYVEYVNSVGATDIYSALKIAEQALNEHPQNGRIKLLYIGSLYRAKLSRRTIDECKKFLQDNPGNIRALDLMAYAYQELNNYEEAVKTIKEAAKLSPNNWVIQCDYGDLAISWAYKARGGKYLSKITPEERRIFSEGVRTALPQFLKAAGIFPENGYIWNRLIEAYRENGYPDEYVERAFEQAYKLIPANSEGYRDLLRNYTYGYSNAPEKARSLINRVIRDYPNEVKFYYWGAWYWWHTLLHNPSPPAESKQEMEKLIDKLVTIAEVGSDYLYDSADMYIEINDFKKANEILKKIAANPEKLPPKVKGNVHEFYRLAGESARKADDLDNAITFYKRCLELNPCPPCSYESHLGLGRIYGMRENYDMGFAELEIAIKTQPQDYSAYSSYGYFAAKSGKNLDTALKYAIKATELEPKSGDNWWVLAIVQEKLGQGDKALENINRALQFKPNEPKYLAVKKRLAVK